MQSKAKHARRHLNDIHIMRRKYKGLERSTEIYLSYVLRTSSL